VCEVIYSLVKIEDTTVSLSLSDRDSSGRVVSLLCEVTSEKTEDSEKPDICEVSDVNPE
jgi:hypothetical protein